MPLLSTPDTEVSRAIVGKHVGQLPVFALKTILLFHKQRGNSPYFLITKETKGWFLMQTPVVEGRFQLVQTGFSKGLYVSIGFGTLGDSK